MPPGLTSSGAPPVYHSPGGLAISFAPRLRRFRTNLHLDLDAPAFAEERWQGGRLHVGPVTLDLLHPCARCAIPTRDPDGVDSRWPALLRHLHRARAGLFGVNARVVVPGRVALGDRATVTGPAAVP